MGKKNIQKLLNSTKKLFNLIVIILLYTEIWQLVIQLYRNFLKHYMNVNQPNQAMVKMLKLYLERLNLMSDQETQQKHRQVIGNVLCYNQKILCLKFNFKNIWLQQKRLMENDFKNFENQTKIKIHIIYYLYILNAI